MFDLVTFSFIHFSMFTMNNVYVQSKLIFIKQATVARIGGKLFPWKCLPLTP